MEPLDLLELFRLETDDISEPYLWSDKEFYTYLNDAHNMFVKRIGGIADNTSAITKITYKIGDTFLKYDERILRIKGVVDAYNRKVTIRNLDNFEDGATLSDDYGSMVNAGINDGRSGPVRYIITDIEDSKFRLYPLPDAAGYLRLSVSRRPLRPIVDEEGTIEIPFFHRLALLDWVKYKAYMKQDVETFDKSKSKDFLTSFNDYVDEAIKEKSSREDRKRTVQYGGIPMA